MNKASRLFCPALITPKNAVVKQTEQLSLSQKVNVNSCYESKTELLLDYNLPLSSS